jgi:hypothetical protein
MIGSWPVNKYPPSTYSRPTSTKVQLSMFVIVANGTYHASNIPDIDAICPWYSQYDFRGSVSTLLDIFAMLKTIVKEPSRAEVVEVRETDFSGCAHWARKIDDMAVNFLCGTRQLDIIFLKVFRNFVHRSYQNIGFPDISMSNVAFLVQEDQREKYTLEYESHHCLW